MPTIDTVVEVIVATWICNWCGRYAQAGATVPREMVAQHFIDTLGWRWLSDDVVACERCRSHPDVAAMVFAAQRSPR
ncbi:hypothetical protein ACFVTX_18050 [Agromyces sp. NPDC058136]|uniref:hypothetical protein n=1 Tax=Agromyces sp. NPDC058136 TaxID=3346354 RepID=UPI0036D7F1D1